MRNPIKTVRRTCQLAALTAFVWLLWEARWHDPSVSAPPPWFLRMDPLAALTTWLAPTPMRLSLFYPALGVVVFTILLGRVFCGWLCPLGTTIDVLDHLLLRKARRRPDLNRPAWKYYVLGLVLMAAVFGTQLAWLVDPIPLLTRTLAVVVYPIAVGAYNAGVIAGRPALKALGLSLYPTEPQPAFALNLAVLVGFLAVVGLSALSRRFWCRSLCPLGALLAFVGRFGLWERKVTGCVKCRRCVSACKMGAVPEPEQGGDFARTLTAECIQCYDCLVCPSAGISTLKLQFASQTADVSCQASRRHFLAALGLGALYGATAATGAGRRPTDGRLIRPPGAIVRTPRGIRNMTEREFRDLCVRCGNCMKACVTGGLQPAVLEAGFDGLFTPMLVPRIGHCEQNCTACGEVCPTGALGQFSVREKSRIQIGLATIHTDKCLAWRKGNLYKLCLVCDEQCSYNAIDMIQDGGRSRPMVDADKCVGCGICEKKCPVKPEAAIVVYRRDLDASL